MRAYDNSTDMVQNKAPHWKSCYSVGVQVQILRATAESFAVQTNLMLTSAEYTEAASEHGEKIRHVAVKVDLVFLQRQNCETESTTGWRVTTRALHKNST